MGTILRKVGASESWKTQYDNKARNVLGRLKAVSFAAFLRHWHPDGLGVPAPLYTRDSDGVLFGRHTHPDIKENVAKSLAIEEPTLDIVFSEDGLPKGFTIVKEELLK